MTAQHFARIIGVMFLLVGLLGFIPGLVSPGSPGGTLVTTAFGYLFGLFPVNAIHNVVHLGIGLWGLVAARTSQGSVSFSRALTILYGTLAVMGLIPTLDTMFGLAPLFGHDIWLHAMTALAAAYYGYYWRPATAVNWHRRAA